MWKDSSAIDTALETTAARRASLEKNSIKAYFHWSIAGATMKYLKPTFV